jgi:hypothetical protein
MGKAQERTAETYPVGTEFHCLRCGFKWQSRKEWPKPKGPDACGNCKSGQWYRPPQRVPHASRGVGAEPAG